MYNYRGVPPHRRRLLCLSAVQKYIVNELFVDLDVVSPKDDELLERRALSHHCRCYDSEMSHAFTYSFDACSPYRNPVNVLTR